MDLKLAGRTALVTGSSKGIGLAVAQWFAREAVNVCLVARSGDRLETEGAAIAKATGVTVRTLAAELTVPVLVSGGLQDAVSARAAFAATQAAGVMLARGSLGNPWLFEQLLGTRIAGPTREEILAELAWVMECAVAHLGEQRATHYLRKFYPWYIERLGARRAPRAALQSAVQQAASLGDKFRHFERLYQACDVVFLQEGASIAWIYPVGKSEQDASFHARAISFEPLACLFGAPLSWHVAIHNECVEWFGEQPSLHILAVLGSHNSSARPRQHIAHNVEHRFFLLHQQHAAVDGALVDAHRRLEDFRFLGARCHCWQANFDDRTAFGRIVRGDVSPMFFHDAVADAQSETSTFADGRRGVERIEDALGVADAGTTIVELGRHVAVLRVDADVQHAAARDVEQFGHADTTFGSLVHSLRTGKPVKQAGNDARADEMRDVAAQGTDLLDKARGDELVTIRRH